MLYVILLYEKTLYKLKLWFLTLKKLIFDKQKPQKRSISYFQWLFLAANNKPFLLLWHPYFRRQKPPTKNNLFSGLFFVKNTWRPNAYENKKKTLKIRYL
jgi:hypothetical protein